MSVLNVFSWDGRIGRARYLATGVLLLAVKHNLDRLLAAMFGYQWGPFHYWVFEPEGIKDLRPEDALFYVGLIALSLPFIWMGTVLTLRRLRDAGLPLWLVMVFFVPFLNLIFFVILVAIPSRE